MHALLCVDGAQRLVCAACMPLCAYRMCSGWCVLRACHCVRTGCKARAHLCLQFPPENILGVQEEVQLREQDFGNFQVSARL